MANIRFKVEPLLTAAARGGHDSIREVADLLGVTHQSVQGWGEFFAVRHGADLQKLDSYAVAVGHHPCALWPDWFDVSLVVPMVGGVKANPDCPVHVEAVAA